MEYSRLDMAYLLKVLRKGGHITPAQEKAIRQRDQVQKEKLTQECEVKSCARPGQSPSQEVTDVDVLASLGL